MKKTVLIEDKVVIITGASSGIGYATAKLLAQKGAKVAVGARRLDRLEKLQNEINQTEGKIPRTSSTNVLFKQDTD